MQKQTKNSMNVGINAEDEEILLPKLEIKQPGFIRFFPPLVRQMADMGVTFHMEEDGALYVKGFYKNGSMKLDFENEKIIAVDKRNRKTTINDFSDMVLLNYRWWKMSNSKSTYVVPERPWLDKFIENKWVKRKVIFEPTDDVDIEDIKDKNI